MMSYKIKIFGIAGVYNVNIILCVYIHNYMCMSIRWISLYHTTGIEFCKEQKEFQRLQASYWLAQSFTLR